MSTFPRLTPLLCLALMLPLQGDPPAWWRVGDPPAIDPSAVPNPQGPANIGQAKWMTRQALDALGAVDATLAAEVRQLLTQPQPNPAGGEFPPILDLQTPAEPVPADWRERQRAALRIGQLKAIAAPFYEVLHAAAPLWLDHQSSDAAQRGQLQLNDTKDPNNSANFHPWTSDTSDDANQAIATIGQLKAVFSLRFESLEGALDDDFDDDGLTHAEEIALGTNPRNADTDGDGMSDGWEVRWSLNPLDPTDADNDTDGDFVSNLREFQLGTCPTGVYRIEVLPLPPNHFFHSARDDGSVVVRDTPLCEPNSSFQLIGAPDAAGNRSLTPYTPPVWNSPETILADLVSAGTLTPGTTAAPCDVISSDGSMRVFLTDTSSHVLRHPGVWLAQLPPDVSWQALTNHGVAAGIVDRSVPANSGIPAHHEYDVQIFHGYYSSTIPMPAGWFPVPVTPSIQAFSDDQRLLVGRPVTRADGSTSIETYLLEASTVDFTLVRQPGLGGESIIALSSNNGRMLGGGPEPFLIYPDGTPIPLGELQIRPSPTTDAVSFATLHSDLLIPNHITSDGRVTLTTCNAANLPIIMQLVPDNDADADGMADDWETSFARMLLDLDKTPEEWGPYYSDLAAGNLDPSTDYTDDGVTASAFEDLVNGPAAELPRDGILRDTQYRRNILAWGRHVPKSDSHEESNDGLYHYENTGWFGAAFDITSFSQLQPQFLQQQILSNSWEQGPNSNFSHFAHTDYPEYTNYHGQLRHERVRLLATAPLTFDRRRSYLKITWRVPYPPGSYDGPDQAVGVELKQLTIPAGQLASDWIELCPPVVDGYKCWITLETAEVTPDYNRDGRIDPDDKGKATALKPWRFWNNDDADWGDTGGTDLPHPTKQDCTSTTINGRRDLIDYFPVRLEIRNWLRFLPKENYTYWLSYDPIHFWQSPGSLAFRSPFLKVAWNPEATAEPDGATIKSGDWQKDLAKAAILAGKSIHFVNPYASGGDGTSIRIPNDMLQALEAGNGLIWLTSGCASNQPTPLALQIRDSNSACVASFSMPLAISTVEDMFRWKFVMPGAKKLTPADIPGNPPNWPDGDRNGKQFIFVHGYNVNDQQSKGWAGEIFKRMFWSGSNARFSAFAWRGYQGQVGTLTPNYQVNLGNAFNTAASFKQFLDLLEGQQTVAAHSMGNILLGSAMHDWGARPANYLMLDSSAAKECYDPNEANDTDQDARMVHPAWKDYPKPLRASEWHRLNPHLAWPVADWRGQLTWKGRFKRVIDNGGLTNVYNFFSSGEEVLNNPETNNPNLDSSNPFNNGMLAWATANKMWAMQEKRKGLGLTGVIHTSDYGGWRPNFLPYDPKLHVIYHNLLTSGYRMRTPAELPDPLSGDFVSYLLYLSTKPFFDASRHAALFTPETGANSPGSNYAYTHRNTLISEMIPCTTFAAGRNALVNLAQLRRIINIDMNTTMKTDPMQWPESDAHAPEENMSRSWLHSDIKDKAFCHNWNVYAKFVELGNLQQAN